MQLPSAQNKEQLLTERGFANTDALKPSHRFRYFSMRWLVEDGTAALRGVNAALSLEDKTLKSAAMKNPAQYHQIFDHEEARAGSSPRAFGFVFTIFFLVIALAPLIKHGSVRIWALGAGGVVLGCAWLAPQLLSVPNKIWIKFGLLLHRITQPLIMGLLFYLVFTPIGRLMRIFKGDSLRRKWDDKVDSYWISRSSPTPDSMKHLF